MKKYVLLAAAASFALAPAAFAQGSMSPGASGERGGQSQDQLRSADQDFVNKATVGGLFEVQSSELAQDKAQSAEVKRFAERMIRDHGKANKELEKLAGDVNAEQPTKLDSRHQQALQKLENAGEGAEFDRAYIQAQRDAHREAVSLFQSYSQSGDNRQLTSWAQKTLPVLQEHAREIQGLNVASGAAPSSSSGRSAAEPQKAPPESRSGAGSR